MSYLATLDKLFALRRFGVRPGLEAIESVLGRLGNPERAFAAVHVAGTNGKGSTAALCESALRRSDRRVGLYTSPHLARFSERIRIDGREIDRAAIAPLFDEVQAAGPELTFFELVTAMAFLAFARAGIEIGVIEVGLGGRLDATNVVVPRVSIVTGIALEHTEVLGDTEDAIAREKAGILRAGVPAVVGAVSDEARAAITEVAARVGAPVRWLGRDFAEHDSALLGPHQRRNAGVAAEALRIVGLTEAQIDDGIAHARWPGRLELVLDRCGDVLLDGAHNPDGARALADALPAIARDRPVHLVLGVVEDKDARALYAPLASQVARLYTTTAPSPRARSAGSLAAIVGGTPIADPWAALEAARDPSVLTVVAGSLFLVGALRARLLGEDIDPIAAQDPAAKFVTPR